MNQEQIQQLVDLVYHASNDGRGRLDSDDWALEDFDHRVTDLIEIFPEYERPLLEAAQPKLSEIF